MDALLRQETKMVRSDDIKRLLEVKDFNKGRTRKDSVGSDASDSSSKSMPQYSSYRTLSGGLLGPFETTPTRPGSRGGFLPWSSSKTNMNTKLKNPGSKLKEPARPRGDGEGSSRPPSRGPSRPISPTGSESSTISRPPMSREGSQSRLPIFKRETSLPQISRDKMLTTPDIRREKSEIKPRKTPIPATPRGTVKPIITETTPKTVAQRKVADRNIAAKGTRCGVSGISENIMIGDKVLIIASNKIGMVQFVGETKFAKGIWAGVVLEDATGKNDGSVSGVRYFSCPALRGVFVKVEKLQKVTDTPSNTPNTLKYSVSDKIRTPKTHTPLNRNESALSIDSGMEEEQDLIVGDQVYITSANATRIGTLRYVGLTEFAKGTWCGVELTEPNGKNDGAVAGTRYFQCEPKYGIFAQIQKVKKCKSCSSSDVSGPLSPLATEEEISINALEAVLQDEIIADEEAMPPLTNGSSHQAEVMPVLPNDMDVMEEENLKDILRKKRSTEKMIHDSQENTIRLQSIVSTLEKEKMSLEHEIGESKHKIEDLQFQLEEQMMITDEMGKVPGEDSEKVLQLESKLAAQVEETTQIQNKLEELKTKHEEDQFLLAEKDVLLQSKEEAINKYEEIANSQKEQEEKSTTEATDALQLSTEEIQKLKESINILELKNTELKSDYDNKLTENESTISTLEEKLKELENKVTVLSDEINKNIMVIKDLEQQLDKKGTELTEHQTKEEELNKNITDLKLSLDLAETHSRELTDSNSRLEHNILTSSKSSDENVQQLSDLHEELQARNREVNVLKDRETTLILENNKLLQQSNEYKATTEGTQEELYQKNNDVQLLVLENAQLRTNTQTLTDAKNSTYEKLIMLENEKQCLTETLNAIKAEREELLQEKLSIVNTNENIKERTEQINNEKEILENEKRELQIVKDGLEDKYAKVSDELKESLALVKKHEEESKLSKKEVTESSKEIERVQLELVDVKREMEGLRLHCNQVEQDNLELNSKKIEIAGKNKSLESKFEAFSKTEAEMTAEMTRLQEKLQVTIETESSNRLTKETECANLQAQVKEFVAKITLLENNNSLLQFELDELQQKNTVLMSAQNKKIPKKVAASEEVENLKFINAEKEQEVEFLNSIIVDLQKKNKEQKDRIDILSYGDDIHEINGNLNDTMSPVRPTLRMRLFCDICDVFDLHDTEDCPQQSNDFGGSQHHGKRGEERPYCIICETFGHTAETCDEEEMF